MKIQIYIMPRASGKSTLAKAKAAELPGGIIVHNSAMYYPKLWSTDGSYKTCHIDKLGSVLAGTVNPLNIVIDEYLTCWNLEQRTVLHDLIRSREHLISSVTVYTTSYRIYSHQLLETMRCIKKLYSLGTLNSCIVDSLYNTYKDRSEYKHYYYNLLTEPEAEIISNPTRPEMDPITRRLEVLGEWRDD